MSKFYDCYYNSDFSNKFRKSVDDTFSVSYNYSSPTTDIHTALIDTCHFVVEKAKSVNKTPCVFYSGGIDSEIIILALEEAGYKINQDFHCIHGVYDNNENSNDTAYVDKFANEYNLDVEKIYLDGYDWYESKECFEFCAKNNISYVTMTQIPRLIRKMNDRNYYPIIGHGDPQIYKKNGIIWHCDFEYQNTWYKFISNNNLHASTHFFRDTNDLYVNYVQDFIKNIEPNIEYPELTFWNHDSPSLKYKIFDFYKLEHRTKFTGHEHYRTDKITQINLQLQEHTKYTINNRLYKPVNEFITNFKY